MTNTRGRERSFGVEVEADVSAAMRDGTVLRADVYRPDAPGRYPVLLQRTPYSKDGENCVEQGHKLAERGYVVVQQDVRGRYRSDGEFQPGFFSADHRDAEDGYDTVEVGGRADVVDRQGGHVRGLLPAVGPSGSLRTRGLPTSRR